MHRRSMLPRPLLLGLLLAVAAPAAAQSPIDTCFTTDAAASLDLRIDGCTRLIESGVLTPDTLAIALQNRGTAYLGKGDPDRAIEDYDRAIRLDPNYANAFNSRGVAYQAKGQNDRALKDYDEAIRLEPGNSNALDSRAFVHLRLSRWSDAFADADAAVQANSRNAWALFERGVAKHRNG